MATSSIDITWNSNMCFKTTLDGHELILDADPQFGGNDLGPRPKALMLVALGGCTGMDVISILGKMRVNVDEFNLKIEGDMTEEHPKHYQKIHVIYEFKGEDLPMDKLQKAVDLSQERYCGVVAVYEKAIEMSSEIRIIK